MTPVTERIVVDAQTLIQSKQRHLARQRLMQAVQRYPRDAHLWYWLAQTLDEPHHALDALQRALTFDPAHQEARQLHDWLAAKIQRDQEKRTLGGRSLDSLTAPPTRRPPSPAPPSPAPPEAPPPQKRASPDVTSSDETLEWLFDEEEESHPTPMPAPVKTSVEPEAPDATLDWLLEDENEPTSSSSMADSPSRQEDGGNVWSMLDDLSDEALVGEISINKKTSPPAEASPSEWSFLGEPDEDASSDRSSLPSEPSPTQADSAWDFLGGDDFLSGDAPASQEKSAPETEESLWERADAFIDPPDEEDFDDHEAMAAVLANDAGSFPAADREAVPEGSFSLLAVSPSPAADIPVRGAQAPLSVQEIEAVLGAEALPEPPSQPPRQSRGGCLRTLTLLVLLVTVLIAAGALGWYVVINNMLPEQVVNANPTLATRIAEFQIQQMPPATPLPTPDWVQEAEIARFNNQFVDAEQLLRDGLANEPTNVTGLVALSELLRDRPGREEEALRLAEQAVGSVSTVEERARTSENFVWAMVVQPNPDLGLVRVSAEQASAETPASPHANWARALALTLEGQAEAAQEAMNLALALSPSSQPGLNESKQADIYFRLENMDQAVELYESALDQTDYLPWRVALIRLLYTLERSEEAEAHLNELRKLAPNDPALLEFDS